MPEPALRALADELRGLAAPAERAFTRLGDDLARSLALLTGLRGRFDEIVAELESGEATAAAVAMREATLSCAALMSGVTAAGGVLQGIADDTQRARGPLLALRSVIEEIGALAINAKMLVAQIRTDSVDFSVFTVEVGRLHDQAGAIVKQATERLGSLVSALTEAGRVNADTVAGSTRGLAEAGAHLDRALGALESRQLLSLRSAERTGELSQGIAGRVGQCIGELQINDMTIQRIEHGWRGLELAAGILAGRAPWAAGLSEAQRAALAAEVCRLQAQQLKHARNDFVVEVEALKANLRALAVSAAEIMSQAASVVAAEDRPEAGGNVSFAADLHRHGAEATALLGSYSAAQRRLHELVAAAADELDALSGDIARIQSIDEDMRLMGLNATLKCARLGDEGRALGVVAHELRACSRRTEELARPVSEAIAATGSASQRLTARAAAEDERAAALARSLDASLRALARLDTTLMASTGALRADGEAVAAVLGAAAGGITVDATLAAALAEVVERLAGLATRLDAIGTDGPPETVRAEVLRTLANHYTMASERAVHEAFTGSAAGAGTASDDAGALDDLFF